MFLPERNSSRLKSASFEGCIFRGEGSSEEGDTAAARRRLERAVLEGTITEAGLICGAGVGFFTGGGSFVNNSFAGDFSTGGFSAVGTEPTCGALGGIFTASDAFITGKSEGYASGKSTVRARSSVNR